MPPKKTTKVCEPSGDAIRWVEGWSYRVYEDGYVKVGTGIAGTQFARWTFRLTSYKDPDYNNLLWRDDCVRQEINRRAKGRGPGTHAVTGFMMMLELTRRVHASHRSAPAGFKRISIVIWCCYLGRCIIRSIPTV